jgi:2,4-dichlorophenol 6-monooxygenase
VIISFDQGVNHALLVPIGDASIEAFSDEIALAFVRKALGDASVPIELTGISSWNMSAQVADSFGRGRVWLAGDACHRFPPTGGLGLNSGVQDAQNLAWKLAAVIARGASPALLQTYEQERRPVALANTAQSVGNLMKMAEIDEALGTATLAPCAPEAGTGDIACFPPETLGIDDGQPEADRKRAQVQAAIDNQRGHFGDSVGVHLGFSYAHGALVPDGSPPPSRAPDHYAPDAHPGARLPWFDWVDAQGTPKSFLDLLDRERGTLFTFDSAWQAVANPLIAVRVLGADQCAADEVLGIGAHGAVLVRPDGHVGWRSRSGAGQTDMDGAIASIFCTQPEDVPSC